MDMSPACSPPTQPHVTASEQQHPRFRDYQRYRAAMSQQLVTGATFASWLESTLKAENGYSIVYHIALGEYPETCTRGRMAPGWYRDDIGPTVNNREPRTTHGPYATEAAAMGESCGCGACTGMGDRDQNNNPAWGPA